MDVKNAPAQFCRRPVLAYGHGKGPAPFRGTTMLEWQVRKLRTFGVEDIMVSGTTLPVAGTRYVEDVFPHRGPLSRIHAYPQVVAHAGRIKKTNVPTDTVRTLGRAGVVECLH